MSSNIDFETQKYLSGIFTTRPDWVVNADRAEAYGPFVYLKIVVHKQSGTLQQDELIGSINNVQLIPEIAGQKFELMSLVGGPTLTNMNSALYGWMSDAGALYGSPSDSGQIRYVALLGMFFRNL